MIGEDPQEPQEPAGSVWGDLDDVVTGETVWVPAPDAVPRKPAGQVLRLRVRAHDGSCHEVSVRAGGHLMLGRSPQWGAHTAFFVPFDTFSRKHASVTDRDGRWFLRDEFATYPCEVDGMLLAECGEREIRHGSTIVLCPELTAEVEIEEES